jgi:hypothetical protein
MMESIIHVVTVNNHKYRVTLSGDDRIVQQVESRVGASGNHWRSIYVRGGFRYGKATLKAIDAARRAEVERQEAGAMISVRLERSANDNIIKWRAAQ